MYRNLTLSCLLLLTAGCCIFHRPTITPPLDPLEEPRHPAVIANRIELLLTQDTPIKDKTKPISVRIEVEGLAKDKDFQRVWSALLYRLTSRNKQVRLVTKDERQDLRLLVTVTRKESVPIAVLELFRPGEKKPIWTHREVIVLEEE